MSRGEIFDQVYDELRQLAAAKIAKEAPGYTLNATALVHEVWLKIADAPIDWQDRTHFLRTAATAMRRILVDRARAKLAEKRGGGAIRFQLPELASPLPDKELLELDSALMRLAEERPEHARLDELRFFGGFALDEAAQVIGVSSSTADRMWRFARAWLKIALSDDE